MGRESGETGVEKDRKITQSGNYYTETRRETKEIMKIRL
jgi:hypothetical protein